MKAKIVRGKGRARCRGCMWKAHGAKREAIKKTALIPKGERCLEIETTSCGPTRFGYLCMDHAEEFYSDIEDAMRGQ